MEVTSSIEEVDAVTKRIKIAVPPETVQKEYEQEMVALVKGATIKGFRPGKAPRSLVEKSHGAELEHDITEKLISRALEQVIREASLSVVAVSKVDVISQSREKGVECTAEVAMYPNVEAKSYKGLKVSVEKQVLGDKEVEEVIAKLREEKATMKDLAFRNVAALGDVADIDLGVTIEGEEPSRPEPVSFVIGNKQVAIEVDEGVIGLEIGQAKEVAGVIASDHRNEAWRGKKATYKISLNKLKERLLPEVNDEWAKSLGVGSETLLELRIKVRESLQHEIEGRNAAQVEVSLLRQLVSENPFEVPQVMVDNEIRYLIYKMGVADPEKVDLRNVPMDGFRENFGAVAIERLKSMLLVDKITELEGLKATDEEIETRVKGFALQAQTEVAEARKFLSDGGRMEHIKTEIERDKVLKLIREAAEVSFTEVAAKSPA